MHFVFGSLCAVALAIHATAAETPSATWVTAGAYGDMHLVIPDDASQTIQTAAAAFQKSWRACTDREIGISNINEGLLNVWLGPTILTPDLVSPEDLQGLGNEGFIIRTYTPPARSQTFGATKQFIITGAADQGTLLGVYAFFRKYMGVRWLAPDQTYSPPKGYSFREIDERFIPSFSSREQDYRCLWPESGKEYSQAFGFAALPHRTTFGAHTVYALLPPDRYFKNHPEYYAEIRGQRAPGQLCAANPQTAEAVLTALLELIRAGASTTDVSLQSRRDAVSPGPDKKVWSISPMDALRPCECAMCRDLDAREGSPMASLLTLVNRVAEGLENAFPGQGYKVHTAAYQYYRKPPNTIRPRVNVIVEVCDRECDFARPLDDAKSPINAAFVDDLEAWSNLTESLHVRDYAANLASALRPHPNLHVIQSNLQLFDQNGVGGVYERAIDFPAAPIIEFDALRSFLLSEYLWDQDTPYPDLMADFLQNYYGDAAKPINAYIELMQQYVRKQNIFLGCYAEPEWWNYELITEADALFQKALAMPLKEQQRRRVLSAYVPVQYAALLCPPRMRTDNNRLILERPPSPALEELNAHINELSAGITERPLRDALPDLTRDCGGATPPRRIETTLEILENERYVVWVTPELQGAIVRWQDKKSGMNLLQENPCLNGGAWRERRGESPAAETYTVADHAPGLLTLEARMDGGIVLRRTLQLAPGSDRLEYAISLENTGPTPIAIPIVTSADFSLQGEYTPESWICENGSWARLPGDQGYPGSFWDGTQRPADASTGLAFYLPGSRVAVRGEYEAGQAESIAFYYTAASARPHIRLEWTLRGAPLEPGETRRLLVRYAVDNVRPGT